MQCVRCGAENKGDRAACWNCFAQLTPSEGKMRKIAVAPKPDKAPPEPSLEPEEVEEPLQVESSAQSEASQPWEDLFPPRETVEPAGESPAAFDLDEPVRESTFVIPELADFPTEDQQVVPEEQEPSERRMYDLDSFQEEPSEEKSSDEPGSETER